MSEVDRIEKRVTLRAPVSRVWRALTNAKEFSQWFGFSLEGEFVVGRAMRGTFHGVLDEAALIAAQERLGVRPSKVRLPDANTTFCTVERLEPERYFSFRWVPYGVDADADLANEVTTLVEFRLEPIPEGTRLVIVESGFSSVPSHRRERAFRMNEGGWAAQAENLRRFVDGP